MTNSGGLQGSVERLSGLRQYQHNGKRVLHKPLLMMALSCRRRREAHPPAFSGLPRPVAEDPSDAPVLTAASDEDEGVTLGDDVEIRREQVG